MLSMNRKTFKKMLKNRQSCKKPISNMTKGWNSTISRICLLRHHLLELVLGFRPHPECQFLEQEDLHRQWITDCHPHLLLPALELVELKRCHRHLPLLVLDKTSCLLLLVVCLLHLVVFHLLPWTKTIYLLPVSHTSLKTGNPTWQTTRTSSLLCWEWWCSTSKRQINLRQWTKVCDNQKLRTSLWYLTVSTSRITCHLL